MHAPTWEPTCVLYIFSILRSGGGGGLSVLVWSGRLQAAAAAAASAAATAPWKKENIWLPWIMAQ